MPEEVLDLLVSGISQQGFQALFPHVAFSQNEEKNPLLQLHVPDLIIEAAAYVQVVVRDHVALDMGHHVR